MIQKPSVIAGTLLKVSRVSGVMGNAQCRAIGQSYRSAAKLQREVFALDSGGAANAMPAPPSAMQSSPPPSAAGPWRLRLVPRIAPPAGTVGAFADPAQSCAR